MTQLSKMVHALDEYDTSEKLSQLIQMNDIKGRPGTTTWCPLAQLLSKVYGGRFVVGRKKIIRRTLDRRNGKTLEVVEQMRTPPVLSQFVMEFDAGDKPELVGTMKVYERKTTRKGPRITHRKPYAVGKDRPSKQVGR